MKQRERGFTLVELLTVIAIIAILAAILLPVLGRAREAARRSTCISQLQQIAVGMRLYKQDYRGYPPDLLMAGPNRTALPVTVPWYGSAANLQSPTQSGYGLGALFPSYVKSANLFNCPNSSSRGPGTASTTNPWDTQYNNYDGYDPAIASMSAKLAGQQVGYSNTTVFDAQRVGLKYAQAWRLNAGQIDRQERRQLYLRNPDEEAVVTWCHRHRDNPGATTVRADDKDLIVYLGGGAKTVNAQNQSGHASSPSGL